MSSLFFYIGGFLVCSALIIFGGSRLTKYGDIIADRTGMGKAWFGLIMMAAVTSLPELFTGISSSAIFGTPDIAVGDVMGSCAFNLLILAILDYFVPGRPIGALVTKGHVIAGFFGVFLITLTVTSIVFADYIPVIGWFSISSLLLLVIYIIAVQVIFRNERNTNPRRPRLTEKAEVKGIPLRMAIKRYILFALVVISGAIALPYFADSLAEHAGISKSFVGTLLVAATTSLPELVVAIAAVRMGSVDIAVGNLLGSNIFNMLILGIDDLLYRKGPILAIANPTHALSGLVALLMTAVAGIGIMYSSPNKRFALGVDAIVLIVLYASLLITLYFID